MLFLRSPGLWRAMKLRGPEYRRVAWVRIPGQAGRDSEIIPVSIPK